MLLGFLGLSMRKREKREEKIREGDFATRFVVKMKYPVMMSPLLKNI